jgi:hypothetical protein
VTPDERLAACTTTCAACEKGLYEPYKGSEFSAALQAIDKETRARVAKFREGVDVRISTLDLTGSDFRLVVCPGRHDRVASDVCRVGALKKRGRCPVCGGEKDYRHPWPLPCRACTTYAAEGYARDQLDSERGEKKAVFIITHVDGLWVSSQEDRRLSEVVRNLFAAFRIEEPQRAPEENVGWRDSSWNDPEGVKALLDQKQIEAVTRLFRWLNLATAKARADALKEGTNLLHKLITGQLTMDALNDEVTERITRYRATADKIKKET